MTASPSSIPKISSSSAKSSSASATSRRGRPHCGSEAILSRHVTRSFGKGADLLVIEQVPMESCPSCGESYFTAKTMHEIERIKALRKSLSVKRAVSVAAYEAADT